MLLLLLGAGFILWTLIVNAGVVNLFIALPIDLDLIIVFIGLLLVLVAMTILTLQQGWERLRHKSVEQARNEAFAEHHRFLRRLDHELKNPLTAIRVGISNLRETCTLEGQQQVLTSMEMQTMRLSRLVTDLRKLAEIETLPLEDTPFDLREVLEETVVLVQERLEQNQRQLSLVLPSPGSVPVVGDRDLLLVAIHNLIDNAFKFSRPEDRIELRAFHDDNSVLIQVSDTGPGILAADAPLVWEELYRGQNTEGIPGSGLGLALVQMIVKRSHGEVSLESQPGQGTTVTIRLPAA
ncbi:MAG: HAMP domain-containing histidine kinase [Chloroflexi bacterium]|nr:HAMP domain-containing histidine kinase [Chloroflexota bacterium]